MAQTKISKELQDVIDNIQRYMNMHKGQVSFVGNICAIKRTGDGKYFEIFDNRAFAYGRKDDLLEQLQLIAEHMKKEEKDFINW